MNSATTEPTLYHRRLKTPLGIRALGAAIVTVNLVFIVVAISAADGDWAIAVPITAMVAAGAFGALLALSHIYVSIDNAQVQVGLWPLSSRTIPLQQIERYSVVEEVRPGSFGGIGLRKAPGNRSAYLWGAGRGLEFQTIDGESITIVSDDVQEVHEILETVITRRYL